MGYATRLPRTVEGDVPRPVSKAPRRAARVRPRRGGRSRPRSAAERDHRRVFESRSVSPTFPATRSPPSAPGARAPPHRAPFPTSALDRTQGAQPGSWALLGDDDVVHVALAEPARRDPHEARLGPQLGDGAAAGVTHAAAQAAHELVEDARERAPVRTRPSIPPGRASRPLRRPARSDPWSPCASRRASPCRGTPCSSAPGRGRDRPATRPSRRRASRSSPSSRRWRWPWSRPRRT